MRPTSGTTCGTGFAATELILLVLGVLTLMLPIGGCGSHGSAPAAAGSAWQGVPVVQPTSYTTSYRMLEPACAAPPAWDPGVPRYGVGDPPTGRGAKAAPRRGSSALPDSSTFGTPPAEEVRKAR